jgi:hypothetical protein
MKFARTLTFAGLAGSVFGAILLAQGCSSSSSPEVSEDGGSKGSTGSKSTASSGTSGTAGAGDASAGGADAGLVGQPPPPGGSKTTTTTAHNFAIHHLYVGDDDPNPSYTADPPTVTGKGAAAKAGGAWVTAGYNLDGLVTNLASTNVCTPYVKTTVTQQLDGNNGIDNAFGSTIIPALGMLGLNLSQTVSEKIIGGSFTIEIDTTGLDDTSTSQTATGLGGQLFAGGAYDKAGTAPPLNAAGYFELTDNWPVSSALLNGTTIASGSKINFPNAYVSSGTWVSGGNSVSGNPVNIELSLSIEGQSLNLTIHDAIVSFDYSVVNGQGIAKNGIIGGVLATDEFVSAINQVVGDFGSPPGQYCSLVSLILGTIYGAQDIIIDSSTGAVTNTAGTPCNGISIGLAFDADEIAVPSVVSTPSDAGAGGKACPAADAG